MRVLGYKTKGGMEVWPQHDHQSWNDKYTQGKNDCPFQIKNQKLLLNIYDKTPMLTV